MICLSTRDVLLHSCLILFDADLPGNALSYSATERRILLTH